MGDLEGGFAEAPGELVGNFVNLRDTLELTLRCRILHFHAQVLHFVPEPSVLRVVSGVSETILMIWGWLLSNHWVTWKPSSGIFG